MMRRTITLAVAVVSIGAGVVAGTAMSDAAPEPVDDLAPAQGTSSLEATTQDPAGGADWGTRVYVSRSGADCVEIGRIVDGTFGDVRPDGAFVARGAEPAGTCSSAGTEPIVAMTTFPASGERPLRTVVFGLGDDLSAASVVDGERRWTATATRRGAFLVVPDDRLSPDAVVETIGADGSRRTTRLGP